MKTKNRNGIISRKGINHVMPSETKLLPLRNHLTEEEDPAVLNMFLSFLVKEIEEDPSKLVPYTEEMLASDKALIAGICLKE